MNILNEISPPSGLFRFLTALIYIDTYELANITQLRLPEPPNIWVSPCSNPAILQFPAALPLHLCISASLHPSTLIAACCSPLQLVAASCSLLRLKKFSTIIPLSHS